MALKAVAGGGSNPSGATSATNLFSSTSNASALLVPKFRLAAAKTLDGTADTRILCVGDSTTSGIGSTLVTTFPYIGSWSTRLIQFSNTPVLPWINSLAIPPSNLVPNADNRWVPNGWNRGGGGAGNNAAFASSGGNVTNLIFTPNVLADSYYVYYIAGPAFGTSVTFTATGGASVNINPSGMANGIFRTLITAASTSTSNTVTITPIVGAGIYAIVGIEPFLSTKKQILVGNAGVGSTSTVSSQWSSTGNGGSIQFIKANVPDLTIISLGINDAIVSTIASTVTANLQTIITAAQVSGDVILMDMPPSSGSPQAAFEATYIPAFQQLAITNNIAYLSVYGRFGSIYQANLMSDLVHPNESGYWDWGAFAAGFINSVI